MWHPGNLDQGKSEEESDQQASADTELTASQDIDNDATTDNYLKDLNYLTETYLPKKPIAAKEFKKIIRRHYGDDSNIHLFKANKDNQNIFHYLIYAEFDSDFISLFEELNEKQKSVNLANNQLLHKTSYQITPLERALAHGNLHYAFLIADKLLSEFSYDSFNLIVQQLYHPRKNFDCESKHCKKLNYYTLCWVLKEFDSYKVEDRDNLTEWITKLINDNNILYDDFVKIVSEIEEEKRKNDSSYASNKKQKKKEYLLPLLHRIVLLADIDPSRCKKILEGINRENLKKLDKEIVKDNEDTTLLSFVFHARNLNSIKILLPYLIKLFDPLTCNKEGENLISKIFRRRNLNLIPGILDVLFTSLDKARIDKLLISNDKRNPLADLLLEKQKTPSKRASGEGINLNRSNSEENQEKQLIDPNQVIAIIRRVIGICPEICSVPMGTNNDTLLMIAIKNPALNKLISEIAIATQETIPLKDLLNQKNNEGQTPKDLAKLYDINLKEIIEKALADAQRQDYRYFIPRDEYQEVCKKLKEIENQLKETKAQAEKYRSEAERLRGERSEVSGELSELKRKFDRIGSKADDSESLRYMTGERDKWRKKCDELEPAIKKSKRETEEQRDYATKLLKENQKLNQNNRALTQEITKLKNQLAELQQKSTDSKVSPNDNGIIDNESESRDDQLESISPIRTPGTSISLILPHSPISSYQLLNKILPATDQSPVSVDSPIGKTISTDKETATFSGHFSQQTSGNVTSSTLIENPQNPLHTEEDSEDEGMLSQEQKQSIEDAFSEEISEECASGGINESFQQTVSSKPLATAIPTKVSSALSRKGLSDKGNLSHQQLIKTLPQNKAWDFGRAIDNGDCFYDAIAQSLNARAMKSTHTLKSLREICSKYIYQLNEQSPKANWVKEAIEKGKEIDDYQAHLATVQYTQEEMARLKQEDNVFSGYAIWGNPHIEGKILAQQLNISLHIIEFHEAEGSMETVQSTHILVTKDKVSQVEEESINYQDEQMIHLAVYRNHFVPILPSMYLSDDDSFNNSSSLKRKERSESEATELGKKQKLVSSQDEKGSFKTTEQEQTKSDSIDLDAEKEEGEIEEEKEEEEFIQEDDLDEDEANIKGKTYASAEELLAENTLDTNQKFSLKSKNNSSGLKNDTNKTGDKGEASVLSLMRSRHSNRFNYVSKIIKNNDESPYYVAKKPKGNYHEDPKKNQKNLMIQKKKVEWISKIVKDDKLAPQNPASTHDIKITTDIAEQALPKERNVEVKASSGNKFDFWLSENQTNAFSPDNAYYFVNNVGQKSKQKYVKLKNANLELQKGAIQIDANAKQITDDYKEDSTEELTTIKMAHIKFTPDFNF